VVRIHDKERGKTIHFSSECGSKKTRNANWQRNTPFFRSGTKVKSFAEKGDKESMKGGGGNANVVQKNGTPLDRGPRKESDPQSLGNGLGGRRRQTTQEKKNHHEGQRIKEEQEKS